jgi:hypothetical protein
LVLAALPKQMVQILFYQPLHQQAVAVLLREPPLEVAVLVAVLLIVLAQKHLVLELLVKVITVALLHLKQRAEAAARVQLGAMVGLQRLAMAVLELHPQSLAQVSHTLAAVAAVQYQPKQRVQVAVAAAALAHLATMSQQQQEAQTLEAAGAVMVN